MGRRYWIEIQTTLKRNTLALNRFRPHLAACVLAFSVLRVMRVVFEITEIRVGFTSMKALGGIFLGCWASVGIFWGVRLRSSLLKTASREIKTGRLQRSLRRFTLFLQLSGLFTFTLLVVSLTTEILTASGKASLEETPGVVLGLKILHRAVEFAT